MASLFDKVGKFARSPQAKRLMGQAQRVARDPRTRQKIADLRGKRGRRER
jgi:hypothetical protein